ncbi:hypothetical protein AB0R11_17740, partial [Streptomyces fradiae]|uniref:hypothetical protein n=1 Tax=Streptomyces fradiae TaxID=1906 RepID=UPI0034162990
GLGALRLLEAVRASGIDTRVYQALPGSGGAAGRQHLSRQLPRTGEEFDIVGGASPVGGA